MSIVIVNTLDAVSPDEWASLLASTRAPHPAMALDAMRASMPGPDGTPGNATARHVVLLERGEGTLRAGLPLALVPRDGQLVMRHAAGADDGALVADMIVRDGEVHAREAIIRALRAPGMPQWDLLELDGVPADSPTIGVAQAWAADEALRVTWTPSVSVASSSAAADASPWPVGVVVERASEPAAMRALVETMLAAHIQWRGTRSEPTPFVQRAARDGLRARVALLASRGEAMATVVRANGAVVATHLAVRTAGTLASMAWAVNPRVADAGRWIARAVRAGAAPLGCDTVELPVGLAGAPTASTPRQLGTLRMTRARRGWLGHVTRNAVVRGIRQVAAEARELVTVSRDAAGIVARRRAAAQVNASIREFYGDDAVLQGYLRLPRLLKPEYTIWHDLQPRLASMRVLDVAVGGGRTTPYFGTMVGSYHASDYAPEMATACQAVMGDLVGEGVIGVSDARDLADVADASCDLLLLSYNGIDVVGGEAERMRVLAAVRRALAPGGLFCFSSHNLGSLTFRGSGDATIAGDRSPLQARLRRIARHFLMRAANADLEARRREPSAMIFDPGGHFAFQHYYIRASAQVAQLQANGFSGIRIFSADTGRELRSVAEADGLTDPFLYYLADR